MADDNKETITVRGCALDSGTLTTDTEIIRMSHCGKVKILLNKFSFLSLIHDFNIFVSVLLRRQVQISFEKKKKKNFYLYFHSFPFLPDTCTVVCSLAVSVESIKTIK
jgi:hypothetical protein